MREPYTQLFVHCVWATWDRMPLINAELEGPIYRCIQAELRDLKAEAVAIGGIPDHVHVLARIPTTVTIADLLKQMKGSSSHLVTHRLAANGDFKWQGGYGAFSVSKSEVPRTREYIENQKQRHRDRLLDLELELPDV